MPQIIDINDDDSIATTVLTTGAKKTKSRRPEFNPINTFHSSVNGSGQKSGLINSSTTPANPNLDLTPDTSKLFYDKLVKHNDVALRFINTAPISRGSYTRLMNNTQTYTERIADLDHALNLEDYVFNTDGNAVWLDVTPQTLVVREIVSYDNNGSRHSDTSLHIEYAVRLVVSRTGDTPDPDTVAPVLFEQVAAHPIRADIYTQIGFTYDPLADLPDMLTRLQSQIGGAVNLRLLDPEEIKDYFSDPQLYSLYTRLCNQARHFRTEDVADYFEEFIPRVMAGINDPGTVSSSEAAVLNTLTLELRRLDAYEVPLPAYTRIYKTIQGIKATKPNFGSLCDYILTQNTQLALNTNLYALSAQRSQLSVPPHGPKNWTLNPIFSTQQTNAITTSDPLALVQAGAGTGKSTTINERIGYLTACGVEPSSITVLSFTNAAADHITELNPDVNSMTTARMIHEVYSHNHPLQQISTNETILNAIPIYYGDQALTNDFLRAFTENLREVIKKTSNQNMTRMSNFIEQHTDAVIEVLDTIGQTTLELEIIISYLKIMDPGFVEPWSNPPQYLIIDEVQDNSAYEFVYTLRYAAKHNASLYMVGDSSQTLYEFRSANPKALNALEASGVFGTYQLTTNYRSNQEILDFANVHLLDIEANQFAKIQLKANSLEVPTAQSFGEKVRLHPVYDVTKKDFVETLPHVFAEKEITEYIRENIAKGEPTAVLCATRRQVAAVMNIFETQFPGTPAANLTSDKSFNRTTFTSFIREYWDTVTAVDPVNATYVFVNALQKNVSKIDRYYATNPNKLTDLIRDWNAKNNGQVAQLLSTYQTAAASPDPAKVSAAKDQFFAAFRENIMNYEIESNSIAQRMTDARNRARKEAQAKTNPLLMASTIHGVKGLEFPHTVVLREPDANNKIDESIKRLFYVALTRARQSEFIIAGQGKRTKASIITDYNNLADALEIRDQKIEAARQLADNFDTPDEADSDTVTGDTGEDTGEDQSSTRDDDTADQLV